QGDPGFVLWRVDFAFLGFTHDLGFPGFETILNFCLKSGVHFSPHNGSLKESGKQGQDQFKYF
ncbi:hypothetical protein, partial [Polaromonas sp.]|uniref:hypothetical protein n=1 Tax=Polaromonas sp. TaxID=1869339 RepID=UPI003BB5C6A3